MKVKSQHSMWCIIWYTKAYAILHNLVVDHNIPKEWIEDEEDDVDEEQIVAMGVVGPDHSRRNQVHNYLDLKQN